MEGHTWFVGVDWGSKTHQVCILDRDRTIVSEVAIEHKAQALAELASRLNDLADGNPGTVGVAIERPRGAVVETLLERGFAVYALNPKQLDRFRDRHTVAGAKDDRRDAYVLADALATDRPRFRRLEVDDPAVIELREFSRADEDLRAEFNRLVNRLREQLHRVWPALLVLCPAADEPWFWAVLERTVAADTPRRLNRAGANTLLRKHRIRRISPDDLAQAVREPSLRVAPGTKRAARAHIRLLLPRLRIAHEQRARVAKEMEALLERCDSDSHGEDCAGRPSDIAILRSLPGVGLRVASTLISEAAGALGARDYAAIRAHGGLAPVTRQSGTRRRVSMRYGCNHRLRNACYHWARTSVQHDPAARHYYAELRGRGHTHGRALRSVADRWLRILMAMLRDRTLYDSAHSAREPSRAVAAKAA